MAHYITDSDLFKDEKDTFLIKDPTIINTKKPNLF